MRQEKGCVLAMKVLVNGIKVSAREVYGNDYLDERFFVPVCALYEAWTGIPTCYGESSSGKEFKLIRGLDGELLAIIL